MLTTYLPGDFSKQRDEGKREIEVTDSDIQGEIHAVWYLQVQVLGL